MLVTWRAQLSKFRSWLPLGPLNGIRDAETDFEQKARVLLSAGQIPVRLNFVADFMIVISDVLFHFHFAEAGRTSDEISAGLNVESRDTNFGEFEVVGPVIATALGFG